MPRHIGATLLLLLSAPAWALGPPMAGEPLPEGAVLRLGTGRLRHGPELRAVAFSPDGAYLASGGGGVVTLWDIRTGQVARRLPAESWRAQGLLFTPDGKSLVTHEPHGPLLLWDVATGTRKRTFDTRSDWAALSPDGKRLAFVQWGNVKLLQFPSGKEHFHWRLPQAAFVAFAGKDTLVSACERGKTITVMDIVNRKELYTKALAGEGHEYVYDLAASPNGKFIAIAKGDSIRLWDVKAGREVQSLSCYPRALAFSPDSKALFARVQGSELLHWVLASGKQRYLPGHTARTDSSGHLVAVSPNGRLVASVDTEHNVIHLIHADTGAPALSLPGHTASVHWAVRSPDGRALATGGEDRTIRFWHGNTGKEIAQVRLEQSSSAGVLAPDGRTLFTADGEMVRLWDVRTGNPLGKFLARGWVCHLAVALGGLAVVTDRELVSYWNLSSGERALRFKPFALPPKAQRGLRIVALALCPRGQHLAVADDVKRVRLYNTQTGALLWTIWMSDDHRAAALTFTSDGKILAAARYRAPEVVLIEVATARELRTISTGQPGPIRSFAFSPDNALLAITAGNTITLCEMARGAPCRTFEGHQAEIHQVTFSPDGRFLLTASADTTALLWGLLPRRMAPLDAACRARLWDDLAGDARPAHRAATSLAATPEALPWLSRKLAAAGNRLDADRALRIIQALEWMVTPAAEKVLRTMNTAPAAAARQRFAARRIVPPRVPFPFPRRGPRIVLEQAGEVLGLTYSPDGRTLAAVCNDGRLLLIDPARGAAIFERLAHPGGAFALAYSPDGKTLATCGADHIVRIWSVEKKQLLRQLGLRDQVAGIAYSRDGRRLAAGSYDGRVTLFDLPSYKPRSFHALRGRVTSVSFSPDGKFLAVGGAVKYQSQFVFVVAAPAVLLDVPSGKLRAELGARGSSVAVTPGGMVLTAGLAPVAETTRHGADDLLQATWPEASRAAHRFPSRGLTLALSRLGDRLAVAGGSYSPLYPFDEANLIFSGTSGVRVMEIGSGQEIFHWPDYPATAVTLSPNGRTLAAAINRSVILLWDLVREVAPPHAPSDRELPRLLRALGGDAAPAFRAQAALILAGDRAVPALAALLAPIKAPSPQTIAGWITQLEDDAFARREAAFQQLRLHIATAAPALRRALRGQPSAELRRRAERLLFRAGEPHLSPMQRRQRRAVTALEQIGTPAARRALQKRK